MGFGPDFFLSELDTEYIEKLLTIWMFTHVLLLCLHLKSFLIKSLGSFKCRITFISLTILAETLNTIKQVERIDTLYYPKF